MQLIIILNHTYMKKGHIFIKLRYKVSDYSGQEINSKLFFEGKSVMQHFNELLHITLLTHFCYVICNEFVNCNSS